MALRAPASAAFVVAAAVSLLLAPLGCAADSRYSPIIVAEPALHAAVTAEAAPGCGPAAPAYAAKPPPGRLVTFGLVTDSHYDTFPAGEKAPWQSLGAWFAEQGRRTTTTTKRRYDVIRDKMEDTIDVFNRLYDADGSRDGDAAGAGAGAGARCPGARPPRMDFVVNLGDLVNNDLMWNLRPILDTFNEARAPHFSIVGNHDMRAHNDRFGKVNRTQHAWLRDKLVGGNKMARRAAGRTEAPAAAAAAAEEEAEERDPNEAPDGSTTWHYSVQHPPLHLVFLDSMAMEPEAADPAMRDVHLQWLDAELRWAAANSRVVLLFAHIPIGVATNAMGPTLRGYDANIAAAFFGHNHKGGYLLQGHMHSVTINGQIETLMTNAFAVVEVFRDRIELTGYGRVPTRVMPVTSPAALKILAEYAGPLRHASLARHKQAGLLPGSAPAELWRHDPPGLRLDPPPLRLKVPGYRKPLVPVAEASAGPTAFFRDLSEGRLWGRRRRLRPAGEPPVDLNSAVQGRPVWLAGNKASAGGSGHDGEGGAPASEPPSKRPETADAATRASTRPTTTPRASLPVADEDAETVEVAVGVSTFIAALALGLAVVRWLQCRLRGPKPAGKPSTAVV